MAHVIVNGSIFWRWDSKSHLISHCFSSKKERTDQMSCGSRFKDFRVLGVDFLTWRVRGT